MCAMLEHVRDDRLFEQLIMVLKADNIGIALERVLGVLSGIEQGLEYLTDAWTEEWVLSDLRNSNKRIAEVVALFLGHIRFTEAIPELQNLLRDRSERLREAAAWSLKRILAQDSSGIE
jgi:hypothetical protein